MLGPMWKVTAGNGNTPLQSTRLGLAVKANCTPTRLAPEQINARSNGPACPLHSTISSHALYRTMTNKIVSYYVTGWVKQRSHGKP